jgi:homopolymeric O-antigen transport system permease protein
MASTPLAPSSRANSAPQYPDTIVWRALAGWKAVDFAELWHFRELLWVLAQRDIKVRYKQAVLGTAWFVLQPLLTTGVFTFLFGSLAGMPSDGKPYPIFAYSAILVYMLFSRCLASASMSLVGNQHLITKVYFPRLLYPLAPALSNTLDFLVGSIVLVILMGIYRIGVHWPLLLTPLFVLLAVLCGVAIGLWLGALNVRYRDVGVLVPLLTQLWMYATPVVYPLSLVKERWPNLYLVFLLNPMTGIVEGFRWAILGADADPPVLMLMVAFTVIALTLAGGLLYFRRMEDTFADRV